MKRKMIFFDVDGTLLGWPERTIPDSAKEALALARANGHLIFINTGRVYCDLEAFIRALGFDGYVYGCGTRVELNGEQLYWHRISHEECVQIMHALREMRIGASFEGSSHIFFDPHPGHICGDYLGTQERFQKLGIWKQADENDPEFTFDKFYIFYDETSDIEGFRRMIQGRFDCIDRFFGEGEIVPAGHSKATGIDLLCEATGIPLEDCFAIGDGANDLAMLRHVPGSIAMGDGSPEIFPYCAYRTRGVREDGIRHALRHFGLI